MSQKILLNELARCRRGHEVQTWRAERVDCTMCRFCYLDPRLDARELDQTVLERWCLVLSGVEKLSELENCSVARSEVLIFARMYRKQTHRLSTFPFVHGPFIIPLHSELIFSWIFFTGVPETGSVE